MSARDAAGSCLEGTPTVSVDLILQAALFYRFRQKVHRTAKYLGDAPFHRAQLQKIHPGSRDQGLRETGGAFGRQILIGRYTDQ